MINKKQSIGSNGFQKRELLVITTEQYPQTLLVEFVQDKCDMLNGFNKGDEVILLINLRGKEGINSEGQIKYFNTLQGKGITKKNTPNITHRAPIAFSNNKDLPF